MHGDDDAGATVDGDFEDFGDLHIVLLLLRACHSSLKAEYLFTQFFDAKDQKSRQYFGVCNLEDCNIIC